MANPFSINPCLFIGIGSTGWSTLHELRQLINEEFGVAGLPCFRYIGIESDAGKKTDDKILAPHAKEYERIHPVYVSIPDVTIVKRRIDPKTPADYMPSMVEWLDPQLIERGNRNYQTGAGNARQAGRMCLWMNWTQFRQAVTTALDEIKKPEVRVATESFLRDEYFGKKHHELPPSTETLVNSAPRVYIFGTLCGGTCSGSFLDIAYFVSQELGLLADVRRNVRRGVADPQVIGMFTITDLRRITDRDTSRPVANCWAALRELDFYYQRESQYSAKFPGDVNPTVTTDQPFDTIYLESQRNIAGAGFDQNDYTGLNQMCAMNLFTEVVAGLVSRKDESRVNLKLNVADYLKPNQAGHMQGFSSFGLSALWYPKYRIAQAINRHLAVEMCDGWLGSDVQLSPIQDQAAKDLEVLLEEARSSLLGSGAKPQCNVHLVQDIQTEFDRRRGEFGDMDQDGLGSFLVNFPSERATFSHKLSGPNGDYFIRMANAEPLVARDLKDSFSSAIQRYFRDHTCAETRAYVAALLQGISRQIESIQELGSLSQTMDTEMAAEVYSSLWTWSVGRRKQSIHEYQDALWDGLRQRVLSQLQRLTGFFMRQTLGAVQAHLGNMENQVAQAQSRLKLFRDTCVRLKAELVDFKAPSHIIIIAAGEKNSIAEDVELGALRILRTLDRPTLRRLFVPEADKDRPLEMLLAASQNLLDARMDAGFGQHSQSVTAEFNIGTKVLAIARNRLDDILDRAAPYVEVVASFTPKANQHTPNFVFCSNLDVGKSLLVLINDKLKDDRYDAASSPLNHFVFFYHEAIALALSDLSVAGRANVLLAEMEKDPKRIATNYTHKLGEKMFNLALARDYQLLQRWLSSMQILHRSFFTEKDGAICIVQPSASGLPQYIPVADEQRLHDLVETTGVAALINKFVAALRSIGREELVTIMSKSLEETLGRSAREKREKEFEEVLTTVFAAKAVG